MSSILQKKDDKDFWMKISSDNDLNALDFGNFLRLYVARETPKDNF